MKLKMNRRRERYSTPHKRRNVLFSFSYSSKYCTGASVPLLQLDFYSVLIHSFPSMNTPIDDERPPRTIPTQSLTTLTTGLDSGLEPSPCLNCGSEHKSDSSLWSVFSIASLGQKGMPPHAPVMEQPAVAFHISLSRGFLECCNHSTHIDFGDTFPTRMMPRQPSHAVPHRTDCRVTCLADLQLSTELFHGLAILVARRRDPN